MTLADYAPTNNRSLCRYAQGITTLTEADANTLRTWMDTGVPAAHIVRALRQNGTPIVGETVLGEHRRGDCMCTR